MSVEAIGYPTITIGYDPEGKVATLFPPAMVVAAGEQVQFRLADEVQGTAKVKLPAENLELRVIPGEATPVRVTQTGVYYTVITLKNPGKVGAMAVLICDV